jgi:hypothetical protein
VDLLAVGSPKAEALIIQLSESVRPSRGNGSGAAAQKRAREIINGAVTPHMKHLENFARLLLLDLEKQFRPHTQLIAETLSGSVFEDQRTRRIVLAAAMRGWIRWVALEVVGDRLTVEWLDAQSDALEPFVRKARSLLTSATRIPVVGTCPEWGEARDASRNYALTGTSLKGREHALRCGACGEA